MSDSIPNYRSLPEMVDGLVRAWGWAVMAFFGGGELILRGFDAVAFEASERFGSTFYLDEFLPYILVTFAVAAYPAVGWLKRTSLREFNEGVGRWISKNMRLTLGVPALMILPLILEYFWKPPLRHFNLLRWEGPVEIGVNVLYGAVLFFGYRWITTRILFGAAIPKTIEG
jgi:hypothetical protein